MTWPYQTISTLAITLLGLTIPLFLFATTLFGKAIQIAGEKDEKGKKEEQKELQKLIDAIRSGAANDDLKGISTELREKQRKLSELNKDLDKIQWKYFLLLTPKRSVLFPAGFFIGAIMLNEVARMCQMKGESVLAYRFLWSLSFFSILVGARRICQCLTLIHKISISPDARTPGVS